MKPKTLLKLIIVLLSLAIAGAVFLQTSGTKRHAPTGGLGMPLLEDLPANRVAGIVIQASNEMVTLTKKEGQWVVKERFEYPADFDRITALVRKLKDLEVGRQFAATEDITRRLALRDPGDKDFSEDERGTKLRLTDKEDKLLLELLVGEPRSRGSAGVSSGGQYVTLAGEDTIYLVDKTFVTLRKAPVHWIERNLVDIESHDIKRIACRSADGSTTHYTLERSEKGGALVPAQALPEGKRVVTGRLNLLLKALSPLEIDDLVDPAADGTAVEKGFHVVLEYELFDGMIFRVYPGAAFEEDEEYYLKMEAAYTAPAPEAERKTPEELPLDKDSGLPDEDAIDGKEEAVDRTDSQEPAAEAESLNEFYGKWLYIIPKWKKDAFVTELDQLLE